MSTFNLGRTFNQEGTRMEGVWRTETDWGSNG